MVRVRRMSLKLIPGLVLFSALPFPSWVVELVGVVDFVVDLCRRELGWDLDLDIIAMGREKR